MADRQALQRAIAAQEALRGTLPDEVVDAAVQALRRELAEMEAATPRRRQVTVLFADLSGFTALSESMDAELVSDLMNGLWARLDVVVTDHGGRIDKHIGDAVMAVWGAESSLEDDPERAVLAGLALQEALARFRAEAGIQLAMRIGISTGPAHLGAVGTSAESTAIGDSVNLASRLEHLAPVDGVLISHDTYRTVRGVFDVQPLGEVGVRGKRDPVRVYLVTRAKPRAFRLRTRGIEGVETRTIGRDGESRALQATFNEAIAGSEARLVMVVAEAGTGKSRLLYEFLNFVELAPSVAYLFTGRALANRQGAPLGLFRDLIATRFDVRDSDPAAEVLTKLRDGFAGCLTPDEADVVGYWLRFEVSTSAAVQRLVGPQFAAAARAHLLAYFAALAANDPVVLALEDLHWADEESLDLLVDLLNHVRDCPVFALGLSRPALFDRRPAFARDAPWASRLDLPALTDDDCRALVRDILQRLPDPPNNLIELIASRAEGNAFYVEELIKMLIDDGVIETSAADETWQLHTARLDATAIPSTLTAVLQARLDALAPEERRVLQCAAVVGRVFWDTAVSVLAGDTDTDLVLDGLQGRELVFRREHTSFALAEEYLFKHALLCDVTYETVLLSERPRLHALTAAWLEAAADERVAEYRETIAGHLKAAGEPALAARHLWSAGQTAMATGTPAAAMRALTTAVGLWDDAGVATPADAALLLAEASLRVYDIVAAEEALARAGQLVETPSERSDLLYLTSWVAATRGQWDLERSLLDQALALAEDAGGHSLTHALNALSWSAAQADRLTEAGEYAGRALALAEQAGDAGETCRALAASAAVESERGDLVASQRLVERELALAERSGNLDEQARAHGNLGVVAHLRGDTDGDAEHYRVAMTHYQRGVELHRRLDEPHLAIRMMTNLAQASIRLGQDDEASALLREALGEAVALASPLLQCICLQMESDRRLSRGEVDIGLSYLGLFMREAAGDSMAQRETDRILARTSLSPTAIEAGMAVGATLDLETVVDEILARPTPLREVSQR